MSSRAAKRLLKGGSLGAAAGDAPTDETESVMPVERPTKPNLFAMLADDDEPTEDQQEEQAEDEAQSLPTAAKAAKKKKKKGKGQKTSTSSETAADEASADTPSKATGTPSKSKEAGDEDEIDRAMKEIAQKYGEMAVAGDVPAAALPTAGSASTKSLLGVERRFASADLEMKRMFGAEAMRRDAAAPPSHRRVVRKTVISTPRVQWPPIARAGIHMEQLPSAGADSVFQITHSQSYQSLEMQYFRALQTLDPAAFSVILHQYPYHVNSLLQFSEIYRMNGDMQTAHDFVERAIYCFEINFHPLFNPALGTCRLSYNHYENRALFLALFRHVTFVGQRGCWRAALEGAKFLLSLSPDDDALGALLLIDYLALRSGEYAFLERLYTEWEGPRNLRWLPNFALSMALLQFLRHREAPETHERSRAVAAMADALIRFPEALRIICEKLDATLRPRLAAARCFAVAPHETNASLRSVRLLTVLYAERCHTLWKSVDIVDWMMDAAELALPRFEGADAEVARCKEWRETKFSGVPLSIQRHVALSDFPAALALLPAGAVERISVHNPMPPDVPSTYDEKIAAQPVAAAPGFLDALINSFGFGTADRIARAPGDALANLRELLGDLFQEGGAEEELEEIEFD
eukprot:m.105869 g.105869  ORF g.105869 m.105869 type:complete len:636 (-) comp8930_c0_seq2:1187-3094(-)